MRITLIAITVFTIYSCKSSYQYSYEDPLEPSYEFYYGPKNIILKDTLLAYTWNIEFAHKMIEAIDFLEGQPIKPDFLLLQEMSPEASDSLAKIMGYNCIYYPTIYHPGQKKEVGNAIFSLYPISSHKKIRLPHPSLYPKLLEGTNYWFRKMATLAEIKLGNKTLHLVSVHGAAFHPTKKRKEFAETLVDSLSSIYAPIIVGGDFNTLGKGDIEATIYPFIHDGYKWDSSDVGKTAAYIRPFLSFFPAQAFQLDHLFTKNINSISTTLIEQKGISDHHPITLHFTLVKK